MNLITIGKKDLDGSGNRVDAVNSREVYQHLEVDTEYSHWIKRAIDKYDFIEKEDYLVIFDGVQKKDYIVTIDMAKELCMVSNTLKGKETRKYFLAIEKDKMNGSKKLLEDKSIQSQMIEYDASIIEAEERIRVAIIEGEQRIQAANLGKLETTIEAYALVGAQFSPNEYAKTIGRPLTKSEKEFITSLPDGSLGMTKGINEPHTTMGVIISTYRLNTYSQKANELLILAGILNLDRTFTKKGEYYGFDWVSAATTQTTHPRYYIDREQEIVKILMDRGVTQGDDE